MASPAPTATLCQLARQGWPLLVAALLTLLLGWSALQEGRSTPTGDTPGAYAQGAAPSPPPYALPHEHAIQRAESEPEGSRGDKPPALRQLCLQRPEHDPAYAPTPAMPDLPVPATGRRQPPSHAPPAQLV